MKGEIRRWLSATLGGGPGGELDRLPANADPNARAAPIP